MTDNFENKVAVDGPVVNGELGSSTFSPGQVSPAGPLGLGQPVTRKREVALRPWRAGGTFVADGVEIFRLWRERAGSCLSRNANQFAMKQFRWNGGQDGDVRPFVADECRHLSRHGFGLRPPAGLCGLGFCPFLVHMNLSAHQQSAGDEFGRLVAIEADRGIPLEGLGSASGLSWHPCCPASGCSAREQPESAMANVGGPQPHVGHGRRSGVHATAGAGYSPRALDADHVCKQATASPNISMGLAQAVCLDPCGAPGDGSQYPDHHQRDQVLGNALIEQPQTNGAEADAQGRSSIRGGHARRRPRVLVQPVDRRISEPRSSSSGVAHRDVTQARRMRQTCVQGTGCDTGTTPRGTQRWHLDVPARINSP